MLYLLPILLILSGCVLTPADRQAYIRAQVQQSQQPTIEIECPEQGCDFRRFVYREKRSTVHMPRETTGMDLAGKAIDGLVKLGGIAAPAWAAVELGRAIRDSKGGDTTITTTTTNQDNDSSTVITQQDNDSTVTTTETHHTEDNDSSTVTTNESHHTEDNDSTVTNTTTTTTTTTTTEAAQ